MKKNNVPDERNNIEYFSQFVFSVLALYLFAPGNVAGALTRTKKLSNAIATVNSHNTD